MLKFRQNIDFIIYNEEVIHDDRICNAPLFSKDACDRQPV